MKQSEAQHIAYAQYFRLLASIRSRMEIEGYILKNNSLTIIKNEK
jgi:hypothetical protein